MQKIKTLKKYPEQNAGTIHESNPEHIPVKARGCRNTKTAGDSSSSYKIDFVIVIKNFLNPERHQNRINESKVKAILLKGWILSIIGASAVVGLRSTGLPRVKAPFGDNPHV